MSSASKYVRSAYTLFLVLLLFAGCRPAQLPSSPDAAPAAPSVDDAATAGEVVGHLDGDVVSGRYLVLFRDDVPDARALAEELAARHEGSLRHIYTRALKGFSARLPAGADEALRRHPDVAFVVPDQIVRAVGGAQPGAPWGLDRVDQRQRTPDDAYRFDATGRGVTAYVVDTGVQYDHADFDGRAAAGFDFEAGHDGADCNGHGTHVAGTLGGTTWGVAKKVRLVSVRVLDCQGYGFTSDVVAGLDWVARQPARPAVANLSLGGSNSLALDRAVQGLIAAGVTVTLAAGNGDGQGMGQDACKVSPARVAEGITVGATDPADRRAAFSNYGSCVDLYAPGVRITSAWVGDPAATVVLDGTSMAAPHVAGVAALYLEAAPAASPAAVRQALVDAATQGAVADARTPRAYLLYSRVGPAAAPPRPPDERVRLRR